MKVPWPTVSPCRTTALAANDDVSSSMTEPETLAWIDGDAVAEHGVVTYGRVVVNLDV
jgi:hypothetical protein